MNRDKRKDTAFPRPHIFAEPAEGTDERLQVQRALGQRIRELRLKKGWSQEAFAKMCQIYRSHMGEIERGESNLTLETIFNIAGHLEITVHELLKGIA